MATTPYTLSITEGTELQISLTGPQGPAGPTGPAAENPMTTAADMIVGGTSGAATRLSKGTSGQVLAMNSDGTAQEWVTATHLEAANTIAKRDENGLCEFGVIGVMSNDQDHSAYLLSDNLEDERIFQFPDASGTLALASQPRFQTYAQGQSNNFSATASYTQIALDDGTFDSGIAIDFNQDSGTDVVTYTGATGKKVNLIGTIDIENSTGSSLEVSLKLAINDVVIDATQCNATVTGNGVGKLHSMWLTELNQNDTISMFLACPDGNYTIVPVRWRLQATSLL